MTDRYLTDEDRAALNCDCHRMPVMATYPLQRGHADSCLVPVVESLIGRHCAKAWDNGIDTAGQYAEQPWVVDDECKPLNPYRKDEPSTAGSSGSQSSQ